MTIYPSDLRASDADREAAADVLRAQCAAGRLDVSELEERLSAALAARTLGELDRLLADFPRGRTTSRAAARPTTTSHTVGLPGLRRFHYVDVFESDRRTTFARALEHIVPAMVRVGYDVVLRDEPRMIAFEIRERPAWVPWVCILGFPIGLLGLTYKDAQRIVVTFDELNTDRTRITSAGLARAPGPQSVRRTCGLAWRDARHRQPALGRCACEALVECEHTAVRGLRGQEHAAVRELQPGVSAERSELLGGAPRQRQLLHLQGPERCPCRPQRAGPQRCDQRLREGDRARTEGLIGGVQQPPVGRVVERIPRIEMRDQHTCVEDDHAGQSLRSCSR